MRVTKETFVKLHLMKARGNMASAMMYRGVEPSKEHLEMLDLDDWTMRDLGELYHDLGFRAEVTMHDATPPEAET